MSYATSKLFEEKQMLITEESRIIKTLITPNDYEVNKALKQINQRVVQIDFAIEILTNRSEQVV